MEWWQPKKYKQIPIIKKSITEASAQVKGSLLFFEKFSKKKIQEAAGDIRFFFTFWAKKPF
jgi:hypothetical protein